MARILVIDDESDVRAVLGQTLEAAGHEVVLAADGREGMKEYRATPADLVITDLYMPDREGLETIAELRRHLPDVRIIAMSGGAVADLMLNVARKLGALAILEKPFLSKQLLAAVEKVLQLKQGFATSATATLESIGN
jgi:DNA-binding NtrC family response regulator